MFFIENTIGNIALSFAQLWGNVAIICAGVNILIWVGIVALSLTGVFAGLKAESIDTIVARALAARRRDSSK